MACRIGMATDVEARVEKLKDDDIVPRRATYEIISNSPMKYREANETEEVLRRACGRHCEGKRGGKFVLFAFLSCRRYRNITILGSYFFPSFYRFLVVIPVADNVSIFHLHVMKFPHAIT